VTLPRGWAAVCGTALVDELRRELVAGHVLHGRSIAAVVRVAGRASQFVVPVNVKVAVHGSIG
jgi:hypothetical protein